MPLRLPPVRRREPDPFRRYPRWAYAHLLAQRGWAGLPMAERKRLDALYWAPVTDPWPPDAAIGTVDQEEGDPQPDVFVPTLEGGLTSTRSAPIVRSLPDNQIAYQLRQFQAFWYGWIKWARPALQRDGSVTLKDLGGAPFMKVVPPKPGKPKEDPRAPA